MRKERDEYDIKSHVGVSKKKNDGDYKDTDFANQLHHVHTTQQQRERDS